MKRLLTLFLCAALLTGCTALPGEERSFALCLGIHAAGASVEATVLLPNYKGDNEYLTLSARGKNLSEALIALSAVCPSRLSFGQLRLLLFSEETAADADFPFLLGEVAAISGMRLNVMTLVTRDDMQELMTALRPQSGVRLSKYLDTLLRAQVEMGFLPGTTLSELRRMGQRQSPALGCAALRQEDMPEDGLDGEIAHLPAGNEGEVHFGGCVLLGQDGRMQGRLSLRETQLLTMLLGRTKDLALAWPDAVATLHVRGVRARLESNSLKLHVTARIMTAQGAPAQLTAYLEQDLLDLAARLNASGCDALGLKRQELWQHPRSADFDGAAWAEVLHGLQVQAEVELLPQA